MARGKHLVSVSCYYSWHGLELLDILATKLVCPRSVFRPGEQFSQVSPDDLLAVGGDVTFMGGALGHPGCDLGEGQGHGAHTISINESSL